MIERLYRQYLGQPGSEKAEELLHTTYASRRRISGEEVAVEPAKDAKTKIRVCVGDFLLSERRVRCSQIVPGIY